MSDYPAELRAMVEAATPGPWDVGTKWRTLQGEIRQDIRSGGHEIGHSWFSEADAALIAQAPSLALKLADAMDLLRNVKLLAPHVFVSSPIDGVLRPDTPHADDCYGCVIDGAIDRFLARIKEDGDEWSEFAAPVPARRPLTVADDYATFEKGPPFMSFARCPECQSATVGLKPPYAINHSEDCPERKPAPRPADD